MSVISNFIKRFKQRIDPSPQNKEEKHQWLVEIVGSMKCWNVYDREGKSVLYIHKLASGQYIYQSWQSISGAKDLRDLCLELNLDIADDKFDDYQTERQRLGYLQAKNEFHKLTDEETNELIELKAKLNG